MQTVSFKIGDEKKRDLKNVESIYKQTISTAGSALNWHGRDSKSVATLKNTNIHLGNEKRVDYTSEAKEKFIPMARSALGNAPRPPNHITLKETKANYFETVNTLDFNYKGEARLIRSTIPLQVMAD